MIYNYNNFLPINTLYIQERLNEILSRLNNDDLKWIANNREYGEKERYKVKEEVDSTLKGTDIIRMERELIESIFLKTDINSSIKLYLSLLFQRIQALNNAYEKILEVNEQDLKVLKKYWESVNDISNIDNAHAMYLSSNNWDFSVFNIVLDKLTLILKNDYSQLNDILSAGVEDVRTAVFNVLDNEYQNLSENDFYETIIKNKHYILDSGICPFFLYLSSKTKRLNKRLDKEKFKDTLFQIRSNLTEDMRIDFDYYYELYQILYFTRLAYDTYEYFGYYSFIRHYAIYKTYLILQEYNPQIAKTFRHYASTYQFEKVSKILEGVDYNK